MAPVRSMPTLSMGMIPPSTRTLTLTMTACRIRQLISLKVFQKESTLTPHPPDAPPASGGTGGLARIHEERTPTRRKGMAHGQVRLR